MNPLFPTDTIVPVLTSVGLLLVLTIPGLLFYGELASRLGIEGVGKVGRDRFGGWDTVAAILLGLFFAVVIGVGVFGSAQESATHADKLPGISSIVWAVVATEAIFITILIGIALVLKTGGFSWWQSLGLRPYPPWLAASQAVLLLLLAYPLIVDALQIWRVLIASVGYIDDSQQDAVRFLAESKSQAAKLVVAVQAVVFAPVQEELIFRGYIYGLARKYLGVGSGLLVSSTLFAGIHLHLPSFAGLFMLAVCLGLAYEWTGSIFVPMAMHALFNLFSVVVLFH